MFHRSGSIFQFIIFPSPMILQKKLKKKKKNGFKYLEIENLWVQNSIFKI